MKIMTNREYHQAEGISKSGLDLIHQSPAKFKYIQENGRDISPQLQKVFDIGSAVHKMVLEPDSFYDEFIFGESFDRRTKTGKSDFADFMARANGRTVIDDKQTVIDVSESVHNHILAGELLSDGLAERSFFHSFGDVLVKCRPDYLKDDVIIDLKTTEDASPKGFAKSVQKFRYDVQAAFYLDIVSQFMEVNNFIFVAVEKKPPYLVGVYELSKEDIDIARSEYQKNLSTYEACLHTGYWQGYSEEIETLKLWRKS